MQEVMIHSTDKTRWSALFSLDVLVSFVATVGFLVRFASEISHHYAGYDPSMGISRYAYVMLGVTFIAVLLLFVYTATSNKGGLFIWLPVFYAFSAFLSTAISGLYTPDKLPFRFVEIFYWVAVMLLAYYSVLTLNTTKFHVAFVISMLPVLAYMFYVTRDSETAYSENVAVNPVYFIAYLMPVVLLIRAKLLKSGLLLLIFAVIILSYKRMAFLAFATSLVAYFYFMSKSDSHAKTWRNAAIAFGAVLFTGILAIAFQRLSGAFGLDWSARMSTMVESGGSGRLTIWKDVLAAFADDPGYWLIGHGHEAVHLTVRKWAHNDFLEVLYNFGLIGLSIYLLFIVKLLLILREMKKLGYRHVGAFAVSLVWLAWGSMFSMLVTMPMWFLGLALFWGITVADFENSKKEAELNALNELYWPSYEDEKMMEPS